MQKRRHCQDPARVTSATSLQRLAQLVSASRRSRAADFREAGATAWQRLGARQPRQQLLKWLYGSGMSAVKASCLMPVRLGELWTGRQAGPERQRMTPARLPPSTGCAWSGSTAQVVGTHTVIDAVKTDLARLVHVAADDQGRRVGPEQAWEVDPALRAARTQAGAAASSASAAASGLTPQQRDPQALTCLRDLLAEPGPLAGLRREPRTDKLRVNAKDSAKPPTCGTDHQSGPTTSSHRSRRASSTARLSGMPGSGLSPTSWLPGTARHGTWSSSSWRRACSRSAGLRAPSKLRSPRWTTRLGFSAAM